MPQTLMTVGYIVVFIAIFYFLFIRPQSKKDKEKKMMLASLKKGDKIVTIGGIHAKVLSSKNGIVTVMIGDTRVKISDWAVGSVEATDEKAELAEEKEAEEEQETESKE